MSNYFNEGFESLHEAAYKTYPNNEDFLRPIAFFLAGLSEVAQKIVIVHDVEEIVDSMDDVDLVNAMIKKKNQERIEATGEQEETEK